jgi:steroid 5-alpha reductase family enzyme
MDIPASLLPSLYACGGIAFACWLLSVLTREYSWVDRIWSIAPIVYAWMFASAADFDARSTLMAVLVTLWGARLTFNYWRKGGYAPGGEDYRWAILRARMSPLAYQAFNVLFIAGYQNVLIYLFTLPAWIVAERAGQVPLGVADVALAALFLAALAGETLADQEQWSFHQRKKAAGGTVDPPFCTTGLFAWSRHPNFFFEQSQWWIFLGFTLVVGAGVMHVGAIGAPLLTMLFLGSTVFTEQITLGKYPSYAEYQKRVSMLLPMPPRGA